MSAGHGSKLCAPHQHGVEPGHAPFFSKDCRRCQEKLAAGLVTGNEPPPTKVNTGWRKRPPRGDAAKFLAQSKRDQAGRAAQRAGDIVGWK